MIHVRSIKSRTNCSVLSNAAFVRGVSSSPAQHVRYPGLDRRLYTLPNMPHLASLVMSINLPDNNKTRRSSIKNRTLMPASENGMYQVFSHFTRLETATVSTERSGSFVPFLRRATIVPKMEIDDDARARSGATLEALIQTLTNRDSFPPLKTISRRALELGGIDIPTRLPLPPHWRYVS